MKKLLLSLLAFTFMAFGADISGTWKGTADTGNGTIERTFVFKVEGNKVTGETSSEMMGKSTIVDGKLDGDTITFSINAKFQDNEMKLNYKGKISGDQIKFSVEGGFGGQAIEYNAKKVS